MLLGAVAFTSCDMDTKPYGSLDEDTAIESGKDLRSFRNQVYSYLRSVTSGSWVYYTDIQMDEFHGLISNGNQLGQFSKGTFTASDDDIEGKWASGYSMIATCNSFLDHCEKMLADENITAANKSLYERYEGEAKFARAYMYFWLADHFCQSYTQTDPNKAASGLPMTTTYNPTGDVKQYPSRSTLNETFSQIENDLNDSYTALKAYEASGAKDVAALLQPNSNYLSSYAVEALQARIALVKGDWATAQSKAEDVINNGNYSLVTIDDYANYWTNDKGTENIFLPYMSSEELGGSIGGIYLSDNQTSAWYIPTYGTLSLFEDGDVRFDTYFTQYDNLTVEGTSYGAFVFNKFPGNPALRKSEKNNFVNMSKPFRLSEMYLIAAEAAARQNRTQVGADYLNSFRSYRINGYESETFENSQELLSAVLAEREKEFLGEGMRWSDLRRTHTGFERYASHEDNPDLDDVVVAAGQSLSYAADDHRFTWPIPKTELDSNPSLKGQQNPGY